MSPILKSNNIKIRIILVFLIISFVVFASALFLLQGAQKVEQYESQISTNSIPRIRAILQLKRPLTFLEQVVHQPGGLRENSSAIKDGLLENIPLLDQREFEYQRLVREGQGAGEVFGPLANRVQENKVFVKQATLELIRAINEELPDEQLEQIHAQFDTAIFDFQNVIVEVHEAELQLMNSYAHSLGNTNRTTLQAGFWSVGVFAVVVSLAGTLLYRSIVRPILRLRNAVVKLSQGNLDADMNVQMSGEVGELATSFSVMAGKLRESYGKLREQTLALEQRFSATNEQNKTLEDTKKAMLAVLEDARQLEEKLAEEKNNLQAILASMNEPLFVADQNRNILMFNRAFERLAELSGDAILKYRHIDQIIKIQQNGAEMPLESRPTVTVLKTGRSVSLGIEDNIGLITLSGKRISVALQVSPLIRENVTVGTVVVIRDISREKQLDEAKTGFISVASHQLRTPLTSMRWFSEMLMNGDAGPITDEQKHFVERVYQGTDRMIALVNLLLQIARVEAGRLKVEPVPLDLKSTTQGVVLTLRNSLENKKQKVEVKTEPDPLPLIPADQEVIWQCIQNLLSNANRYGPENSTISVSIIQKDGMIQYSVKDTGIGIPKEQQARIFEKFFRAENALKAVPEGSGLGLSLVKSLVEGWGGKVWFETEEGKGTTFFFTIPLTGMKAREGEVRLAV